VAIEKHLPVAADFQKVARFEVRQGISPVADCNEPDRLRSPYSRAPAPLTVKLPPSGRLAALVRSSC
jgi:hypothetical protein